MGSAICISSLDFKIALCFFFPVNLWKIYKAVETLGGYDAVSILKQTNLSQPAAGLSPPSLVHATDSIILLIYCARMPTAQVRKLRSRSCICLLLLHSGNYDGFRSHHAHSSDRYDHNEDGGPSST